MRAHFFEKVSTLDETLRLKEIDHLFLYQLKDIEEKKLEPAIKEQKIIQLIKHYSVEGIIRIANSHEAVRNYCLLGGLEDYWKEIWCSYGLLFNEEVILHPYKDTQHFEMVCGIFFFQQAEIVREKLKMNFSISEVQFLEKALSFRSIHALQRYSEYIYDKIEKSTDEKESLDNIKMIINLCKDLRHHHGSYAYVLLAQAYYRYGLFMERLGNKQLLESSFNAARQALEKAKQELPSSKLSLHNASFGKGLKNSNKLQFETIEEMQLFLNSARCAVEASKKTSR